MLTTYETAMLVGCLAPALIAAYTDVRRYIVDDRVSISILLAGLTAAILAGRLGDALLGAGVAGALLLVCCLMGGMGGGDLKLATGLGMWFSYPGVSYVLAAGGLIAVVWGAYRLACLGKLRSWAKTFGLGLMLRAWGVKGAIPMGQLPEDGSVPQEAVPFGTCLALAAWGYAVWLLFGGRGLNS
ncbi:MAG: A24 family peptidase [Thermoanaerobacterales bacterium]|nr:A24 family peptidase [Thermoanaerobacterales bacterium]